MASKRTNALRFPPEVILRMKARDGGCIFCQMGYHMDDADRMECGSLLQAMHYIGRAQGGLGIIENGAMGCIWHHQLMDNGNKGLHDEMQELMAGYLRTKHKNWDKVKKVYSKWEGMEYDQ